MIQDTFKVMDESVVAIKFIQKDVDIELSEEASLGGLPLKKNIEMPRKILKNGQPDLETFLVILKGDHDQYSFAKGTVELLIC